MIPHLKIAAVLMTITAFSMALFIFAKGWKNKENLLWILFNVCVVLYSSGLFFSEVPISDIHRSYLWWRFAYLGIIFIPTIYYHFITVVVGTERKRRFLISFFYADGFIFLFLNFLTPWFFTEKGLRYVLGRFYIVDSNPVWNVFLAMWIIQVLASMIEAILQYRYLPKAKQDQLKYVITGMIISYAGGVTNYLPCFNFEVYPYGVYLVPVYIILTSYAIIRYRFMEIDTVVHKTILWMTTSLWLIIPAYILFKITRQWIREMSTLWLTIFALAAFYVFLSYYRYFQPKIDHFFRRRKYDYQTILGKVAEKIATSINIEELARNLLTEICETMYLRNSLLYILARNEMKYLVIGRKGGQVSAETRRNAGLEVYNDEERKKLPEGLRELSLNHPMGSWFTGHQDLLEKEQIEVDPQYLAIKDEALAWFETQNIELIVPLVFENEVHALLALGKKENLQAYTVKDIELLRKLGQEVGVTVFNVLHYKDLLEKERMDEEMRMGRQIQTALLPQVTPLVAGLSIQGLMRPAKEIGGDYYDFIALRREDELAVIIGDVSGKGVAAGILMAMAKTAMHAFSQESVSPKEILLRTNQILNQHIGGQKFMTLLYLLWRPQSKSFLYSSAGHEHILICRAASSAAAGGAPAPFVEAIMSGGFMLGMLPDIGAYLEETQIEVKPDDKILLYTDGVTEAENKDGSRFGLEKLKEVFAKHSAKPANELMQAVKDEVYEFIGDHPQYDDITLVVLEAQ